MIARLTPAVAVLITCLTSACYESTGAPPDMRIIKLIPDAGSSNESWECSITGKGFKPLVYRNLSCGYPYGTQGMDQFEVTVVRRDTPGSSPASIGHATWQSEKELQLTIPAGLAAGVYDVQVQSPLGAIATKEEALTILEGEKHDTDPATEDSSGTDSDGTDSDGTNSGSADSASNSDTDDIDEFLDQDFGQSGKFLSPSPLGTYTPNDAVAAPDGTIFMTGSLSNGKNTDLVLLKLTAAGAIDKTFDAKGYITRDNIDGGNRDDVGTSVALAPDGDLLVCGHSGPLAGDQRGFLWKVSTAGVSDPSFGANGTYLFDPGYKVNRAEYDSLTGHIVAVGTFDGNVHVFRVLADGSKLDPKFNGGAPTALHPASTKNAALEPLHDGTLLVGGDCIVDTHYHRACSWRVDTKGAADTSYANDGAEALIHFGTTKVGVDGLWNDVITATDAETRVILAGSRDSDELLAKVHLADGAFDSSFGGGDGIWTEDILGIEQFGQLTSVTTAADGSLMAATKVETAPGTAGVAIIKLSAEGVRDTTFASEHGILSLGADYQFINPKLIPHFEHRVLIFASEHETNPGDIVFWAIAI